MVSDKVTEKPAVWNANLPTIAAKRAGLSAAYDYYPFGMQMPGRVVEDATVQCIPVTRTRKVDKITSTEDLMVTYSNSDLTAPRWTNSGSNTQVTYVSVTGGWRADLKSLNSATAIDAFMTFRALPASASGLIVSVTMAENNYPAYNYPFSPYTLTGTLTVELRNLASGGSGTFLVTGSRTAGGSVLLTVPPGMVAGGNVIRLWMHYDGPPVPRSSQPGNPPLTTPQSNISYTSVVSNVLQPVDQEYVALSCDTDGAYAATYRYGFNGQQKDDELKGKGNSLDFGARMYDSRLGRFLSVDPMSNSYPNESPNIYAGNNPIQLIDVGGNFKWPGDKAQQKVMEKKYPHFTKFMRDGELQRVLGNREVQRVLLKYTTGSLTPERIKQDSKYGEGVEIYPDLVGYGRGYKGQAVMINSSNESFIRLNPQLLQDFEDVMNNPEANKWDRTTKLIYAFRTLFHEYVHVGDNLDGWDAIQLPSGEVVNGTTDNDMAGDWIGNVFEEGDEAVQELFGAPRINKLGNKGVWLDCAIEDCTKDPPDNRYSEEPADSLPSYVPQAN